MAVLGHEYVCIFVCLCVYMCVLSCDQEKSFKEEVVSRKILGK